MHKVKPLAVVILLLFSTFLFTSPSLPLTAHAAVAVNTSSHCKVLPGGRHAPTVQSAAGVELLVPSEQDGVQSSNRPGRSSGSESVTVASRFSCLSGHVDSHPVEGT